MRGATTWRRPTGGRAGLAWWIQVLAGLAVVASLAAAPTVAASPALPVLFTGLVGSTFRVRPPIIGGWTGDANGFIGGSQGRAAAGRGRNTPTSSFGHIAWTTWTAEKAIGKGVPWVNDCTPTCGNGTFGPDRATKVVAATPQDGRFTRLTFVFDYGSGYKPYTFKLVSTGNDTSWQTTEVP
jgi:hypothetical protein